MSNLLTIRHPRYSFGFALILAILSLFSPQGWTADLDPPAPPPFKEKEWLAYKGKGRSALSGQVFLGASSGKAMTQAGVPVHLIPVTQFTRYWFNHHIRTSPCLAQRGTPPGEQTESASQPTDCVQNALAQVLADNRMLPYLRTTRANPTGHFWFTKIPAGRYYILSVIEGGASSRQEERTTGIAWLMIELEAGEKAVNQVVTDCKGSFC